MVVRKKGSTECVHGGRSAPETASSATTPIVHSGPFTFKSVADIIEYLEGRSGRQQPEYGRQGNPTVRSAERRLASLEGAEQAQLFGSGMAAITSVFLAMLKSGDHLVLTSDIYKRTRDFGEQVLNKFGVETQVVAPSLEAIEKALKPETRMVFTETPTNPYQYVVDIEGLGKLGRERGVVTVVDSTFATPLYLRPLEFGVDLALHSATKYLGGHNDLIAGAIAGSAECVQPVVELLETLGGICDPTTAFLLERGMKTLALRMAKHSENGQAAAEYLEAHAKVQKVYYPGLASHPDHEIARRILSGCGGVVTFTVDADSEGTARFVDQLKIPLLAPSLGGVESLVEQVILFGFLDMAPSEREAWGVPDNLVRFSIGIEDAGDIIADLEQALAVV